MAEPQAKKKNKKSKKKAERTTESASVSIDKDVQKSVSFINNNEKQAMNSKASGITGVAATTDCKAETVGESSSKKKKKSNKKKSKEVLNETLVENNKVEPLLNFSENGIQLVNHPEISVTITDSSESKDNEKPVTEKMSPLDEEKQNGDATVTASKKKKKKKKKKKDDNNLPDATSSSNDTAFATPTYTKVVTSDNTCVLVVNNEHFSVDTKSKENTETAKNKIPEKKIDFSVTSEKKLGNVLLTKKFSADSNSSDTNIQFNNSVSIFPVFPSTNSNAPATQTTNNSDNNLETNSNILKSEINEVVKENLEESKPTKSQLKAERRAKQEAQRAAKLAKSNLKSENTSATNDNKNVSPKEKSLPKESVSKTGEEKIEKVPTKLSVERESLHKVKLFSHLPQCKQFDINVQIHPAVLEIGSQYNKGIICGSNARCVALLDSLKEVIKDFTPQPDRNFCRDLESSIQSCLSFLSSCRPLAVSMINAVRFLKHEINRIPSDVEVDEIKGRLFDFINNFVKEDILIAKEAIGNCASYKIVDGDVILVFAFSSLVRDVLCKAHNKEKLFRVVVVDSRPKLEGVKMLRYLVKQGLHCSYISINAVSYIMKEVSKVILGAHALLSNGYVVSRVGNKQIALVASTYDVPVFVCCESYKLCERVLTDSFVHNEIGEPEDIITASLVPNDSLKNWRDLPSLQPLNLLYDVTSPDLISEIITEKGALPCTSVPVILRMKHSGMSQ